VEAPYAYVPSLVEVLVLFAWSKRRRGQPFSIGQRTRLPRRDTRVSP
jgi:hypothetical protein